MRRWRGRKGQQRVSERDVGGRDPPFFLQFLFLLLLLLVFPLF